MQTVFFNNNAQAIEKDIAINLAQIWDFADNTTTSWTTAVNIILSNTAKQNGRDYLVASKLKTSENPEWLYDLTWFDNNTFGLNDVCLIVESEWKKPFGNEDYFYDIQYDFEKLILGRAKHRLMIFEGENLEENMPNLNNLKSIVKHCTLTKTGDRYMFATWDKAKQEFYFDLFLA